MTIQCDTGELTFHILVFSPARATKGDIPYEYVPSENTDGKPGLLSHNSSGPVHVVPLQTIVGAVHRGISL